MIVRGGPAHYKKAYDNAKRDGFIEMAKEWGENMLPQHFAPGAEARYGYAPRTSKYMNSRAKRGKPPLVFSGRLRDTVSGHTITGYKSKAKVRIPVPWYVPETEGSALFGRRVTKWKQPFIAKELTAVSADESAALSAIMTKMLTREMNKDQPIKIVEG